MCTFCQSDADSEQHIKGLFEDETQHTSLSGLFCIKKCNDKVAQSCNLDAMLPPGDTRQMWPTTASIEMKCSAPQTSQNNKRKRNKITITYYTHADTFSSLVHSSVFKAAEQHAILIKCEWKETPPVIITGERTFFCSPLSTAVCQQHHLAVRHRCGPGGQTVNLTPSLPGGKPPGPLTWPRIHVCTPSVPWVVSYLCGHNTPSGWHRTTRKHFLQSYLISDSSRSVVPPARYEAWRLTLYIFNESAWVFPCYRWDAHLNTTQTFIQLFSGNNWIKIYKHMQVISVSHYECPRGAAFPSHFVMDFL